MGMGSEIVKARRTQRYQERSSDTVKDMKLDRNIPFA